MGGLLTKYILTNEENETLRATTRACVFFSVPHFGAELGQCCHIRDFLEWSRQPAMTSFLF